MGDQRIESFIIFSALFNCLEHFPPRSPGADRYSYLYTMAYLINGASLKGKVPRKFNEIYINIIEIKVSVVIEKNSVEKGVKWFPTFSREVTERAKAIRSW